jgi:hypothetical protein
MMPLVSDMLMRDRHERMQREADQAHDRRLAAARPQQTNRPERLRFLSRR